MKLNRKMMHWLGVRLVEAAKEGHTVYYHELSKPLQLTNSRLLSEPLGELSELAMDNGFPPISAVVINVTDQLPGTGFFKLVGRKLRGYEIPEQEWLPFFAEMLAEVFAWDDWDDFLEVLDETYGSDLPATRAAGTGRTAHPDLARTVEQDLQAEEIEEGRIEGGVVEYYGRRYERDPENRRRAIEIHGLNCVVCGFNFEEVYGPRGRDFIEVHHVKPLKAFEGVAQVVDPKVDLVPICANCHRMIHRRHDSVLTPDQLRRIVEEQRATRSPGHRPMR